MLRLHQPTNDHTADGLDLVPPMPVVGVDEHIPDSLSRRVDLELGGNDDFATHICKNC